MKQLLVGPWHGSHRTAAQVLIRRIQIFDMIEVLKKSREERA